MEIINILRKEGCPENVIEHSIAVCKKSMEIASNFNDVNLDLIKKGALLHDIGRSRTHGIKHALIGAEIANNLGFSKEVCGIIERHIGAGITEKEAIELNLPHKSYVPQTLEEKIVAHADNLLSGDKEVNINFTIEKWEKKIENPKENIKRLILLDDELIKPFRKE